jgi:hypothetical protein
MVQHNSNGNGTNNSTNGRLPAGMAMQGAVLLPLPGTQAPLAAMPAPAPTAPQAAAAPAPVQPPKGLTLQAQRCLAALQAAGALVGSGHAGLTRKQLHSRTGQAKGWAALLGAPTRQGGQAGASGLQARGLVACQQQGGVLVYWLTPAGQAALAASTGAPTA